MYKPNVTISNPNYFIRYIHFIVMMLWGVSTNIIMGFFECKKN